MPSVRSSAVYRVEYDDSTEQLDIWFDASGRYSYYRVPRSVYDGLMAASSKGGYFNDQIRDRYGVR